MGNIGFAGANPIVVEMAGLRSSGVLHRTAIVAVDKVAVAGVVTPSDQTASGGTLAQGTTYYVAVIPYNLQGLAGQATPTIVSQATAAAAGSTHSVRAAFAAVAGAVGYQLFLSADATGPKWVGHITEAQRLAGGVMNAKDTYAAGGAANSIDIGVVGVDLQCNGAPFLVNNAYVTAGITPIVGTGYTGARIHTHSTKTNYVAVPSLSIIVFEVDQLTGNYHARSVQVIGMGNSAGQGYLQDYDYTHNGSTGFMVLVDAIGSSTMPTDISVELY